MWMPRLSNWRRRANPARCASARFRGRAFSGSPPLWRSLSQAEVTGFDEGERTSDWIGVLNRRGIDVETEILRPLAAEVLADYRRKGARIYNP